MAKMSDEKIIEKYGGKITDSFVTLSPMANSTFYYKIDYKEGFYTAAWIRNVGWCIIHDNGMYDAKWAKELQAELNANE